MFVHSKSVVHRFVTGFIAAAVFVQEILGHTSRRGPIKKTFFFVVVPRGFRNLQIFDPTEIIEP